MKKKKAKHDLIKCGKHQKRLPWHIICEHLLKDPTLGWMEFPDADGGPSAFTCPECSKHFVEWMEKEPANISHVRPGCVACVRDIRRIFDPNYKEENEKGLTPAPIKARPSQTTYWCPDCRHYCTTDCCDHWNKKGERIK